MILNMYEKKKYNLYLLNENWLKLENLLKCPICFGRLENPISSTCDHTFCKKCINSLMLKNLETICPICKKLLTKIEFNNDLTVKNLITNLQNKYPETRKEPNFNQKYSIEQENDLYFEPKLEITRKIQKNTNKIYRNNSLKSPFNIIFALNKEKHCNTNNK